MRESARVGRRAAFYDEVGATRDVFQSHGLLLLGRLVAGIANASFSGALTSLSVVDATRARYEGYEDEGGKSPDAETAARATLRSSLLPGAEIVATYGKALPNPGVSLSVESSAGRWRLSLQPEASLVRSDGSRVDFPAAGQSYDAYEGALAAVLSGDFSSAPAAEDSLAAWRATEAVLSAARGTAMLRHAPDSEPAW